MRNKKNIFFQFGYMRSKKIILHLQPRNAKVNVVKLSHGVTGNTSVFGTEESRFEP